MTSNHCALSFHSSFRAFQYLQISRYPELGIFSVLAVGILTLFFHGLLNLAKVFLDPLDNEDYAEGCVYLDLIVLIRESNAGSTRWMKGVVTHPPK